MWHRAADIRTLLLAAPVALLGVWLASVFSEGLTHPAAVVVVSEDGARVEILTPSTADASHVVFVPVTGREPAPMMGRWQRLEDRLVFSPVLPFSLGQDYTARWRDAAGRDREAHFRRSGVPAAAPTVVMQPQGVALPANALKFYLHFSQPMEQGVFLDRLRLTDGAGREVVGPFRETELWSPDGRRLTVWFHPGRQKTGVNLNVDEGPVLHAGQRHTLHVAGTWRSAQGVPLGADQVFSFDVGAADHACPVLAGWRIQAPKAGSQEPLRLTFDEPLDTAMLGAALQVRRESASAPLAIQATVAAGGLAWSAVPEAPWQSGAHELVADPLLEDLAGNNLEKPFEVDLTAVIVPKEPPATRRRFVIP